MMLIRIAFTAVLLSITNHTLWAQRIGSPYLNSDEIIKKGTAQFDEGMYKDAIRTLSAVVEGDSLYDLAQYELALTLEADSNFTDALVALNQVLKVPSAYTIDAWLLKGTVLDDLNRVEDALGVYSDFIEKYGYYHRGYYERAVCEMYHGRHREALKDLVQSMGYFAMHPRTHLMIGQMALADGQPALSIMAYQFAAICAYENVQLVGFAISQIEGVHSQESQIDPQIQNGIQGTFDFAKEPMQKLNDLILSKVALDKSYKSKIKGNYTFAKQLQIICENLPAIDQSMHPILQFYIDFYARIWEKNLFNGMATAPFAGMTDNEGASLAKKYQKDIQNMFTERRDFWTEHSKNKTCQIQGRIYQGDLIFSEGRLLALGKMDAAGNPEGPFVIFNDNGGVYKLGNYVNGQLDGIWKTYSPIGYLESEVAYKSGVIHGLKTSYNELGIVTGVVSYVNGKEEGLTYSCFPSGAKQVEFTIENDQINGPATRYFEYGPKDEEMTFDKGVLVGKFIEYHYNGGLNYEANLVNGKLDGLVTYYDIKKRKRAEGNLKLGERTGEWRFYGPQGELEETGSYVQGLNEGEWKEYYTDGKLKQISHYKNGKLHGPATMYDVENRKLNEVEYKNGKGINYSYFNVDGSIIHQAKSDGGRLNVENYNDLRNKSSEGVIEKEEREGEWKFYFENGAPKSIEYYLNGKKDGVSISFHSNGEKESETYYHLDVAQGYFKKYNEFGVVIQDGYYLDDQFHGPMRNFYPDGTLKTNQFYWKGSLNGSRYDYFPNGKISKEFRHKYGIFMGALSANEKGELVYSSMLSDGNGDYRLYHTNGSVALEGKIKYSSLDGTVYNYDPNHNLESIDHYQNADLDGHYEWKKRGRIIREGNYSLGKQEGKWSYYQMDGKLSHTAMFSDDVRNGEYKVFYPNGGVHQVRNYKNDDRHGDMFFYGEDGQVGAILHYFNGVLISYSYLDAEKNPVKDIPVVNETGHIVAFYANGKKSLEINMVNGEYDGEYLTYYTTGKIHETIHYLKGNVVGLSKQYYPSGNPYAEENYKNGELDGDSRFFSDSGEIRVFENFQMGMKHGPATYKYDDITINGRYYYDSFFEEK
jgi:antitoxin component YwqK of YwqJK toxin-antitoxin module